MEEIIIFAIARMSFLSSRAKLLLKRMELSEREFLQCDKNFLRKLGLCRQRQAEGFNPKRVLELARKDLQWLQGKGCHFIPIWSDNYPQLLRHIFDPPFGIFLRCPEFREGYFEETCGIAVVGTRKPSSLGSREAMHISHQLVKLGICVVSGLARGIDSSAHRGALKAKQELLSDLGQGQALLSNPIPTIAVLAHGLDLLYPQAHALLASEILQAGGALISEYPIGTQPLGFRFPERNRIISGLSAALLLVEAPEKSGALITVDFALEQGRDVFLAKNLLNSRLNQGGYSLYKMGAKDVESAEDIILNICPN